MASVATRLQTPKAPLLRAQPPPHPLLPFALRPPKPRSVFLADSSATLLHGDFSAYSPTLIARIRSILAQDSQEEDDSSLSQDDSSLSPSDSPSSSTSFSADQTPHTHNPTIEAS
eukprot:TRINITY_DN14958_c0_g1_i1.p1 TRINITY_DN14958_c0_g1~~TRINITY_DN14958_c0_g1_i1.p1  ORF type:complete len:115 (-),score=28.98 TRINITY_DN14958_c0_g1_i1:248-592(-)